MDHIIAILNQAQEILKNQPHNLDGSYIIRAGAAIERCLTSLGKDDIDMAYIRLSEAMDEAIEMDDQRVCTLLESIEDELDTLNRTIEE